MGVREGAAFAISKSVLLKATDRLLLTPLKFKD